MTGIPYKGTNAKGLKIEIPPITPTKKVRITYRKIPDDGNEYTEELEIIDESKIKTREEASA
jgi:hypothetical protein